MSSSPYAEPGNTAGQGEWTALPAAMATDVQALSPHAHNPVTDQQDDTGQESGPGDNEHAPRLPDEDPGDEDPGSQDPDQGRMDRMAGYEHMPADGPWLLVACAQTAEMAGVLAKGQSRARNGMDADGLGVRPVSQVLTALGFVRARILDGGDSFEVVDCRAGGRPGSDERSLVAGFWASFDNWQPRLVTYNGRGMLLPVLRYASMRHHLCARWLHEAGDRWTGYGVRFCPVLHVDVMDWLSDQHASPYASLHEVCRSLGLPACEGPDTARALAEREAAQLFLIFLRYQLYMGVLGRAGHDESVRSLRVAMQARGEENPALALLAAYLLDAGA